MPKTNLVVSIFDSQLDIVRIGHSQSKAKATCSPILSLPDLRQMPIPSKYLILYPKSAENIVGILAEALKTRIANSIKIRVQNESDRNRFLDDFSVEPVSVNYANIWNLESCNASIEPVLKDRIGDWEQLKTVVLNLVGGTAAAKTALFLASSRLLRENQEKLLSKIREVTREKKDVNIKLQSVKQIAHGETHQNKQIKYLEQDIQKLDKQLNALHHLNQLWVVRSKISPTKTVSHIEQGTAETRPKKTTPDSIICEQMNIQHPHSIGLLTQGIGTRSAAFAATLDRLEKLILTSRNEKILITGPTGSGKSELAKLVMAYMRALHKDVNEENCIHLNVAAMAPTLIESELFGYEKGAYSGAVSQHKGIFERADKGVVFLDEIGELRKDLQAKLLAILDGVPFTRLGGTKTISSDFLLLCGTNVNLEEACEKGTFRRDLFERLRTWTIEVPSINDRIEDIEVALQRERGEWLRNTGIEIRFEKTNCSDKGKEQDKDKGALDLFMERARTHRWVGNFREFHATFVHLAMAADNGIITKEAVEDEFLRMEKACSCSLPMSDKTHAVESDGREYDMADIARLACALDVCRKAKTATEAGEILFAARANTAKRNGTQFNGASSLQRIFSQFGLKAVFKHGTCSLQIQ